MPRTNRENLTLEHNHRQRILMDALAEINTQYAAMLDNQAEGEALLLEKMAVTDQLAKAQPDLRGAMMTERAQWKEIVEAACLVTKSKCQRAATMREFKLAHDQLAEELGAPQ